MLQSGGADKLMVKDVPGVEPSAAVLLQGELVMLVLIQILALYQLLKSFRKKNDKKLSGAVLVISVAVTQIAINTPPGLMQMGRTAYMYPMIVLMVAGITFLGAAMIEQWKEATIEESERQERIRAYKKERKRRLKFEGRYSRLFYQIIWKNFCYNKKEYSLFFVSMVTIAGVIFSGFGIRRILTANASNENFLLGEGLGVILMNFIVVSMLMSVCLLTFILLYYLKSRMRSLSMLLILGIRRKTLFLYCGLELFSCFLAGNVLVFLFKRFILFVTKGNLEGKAVDIGVYAAALLCVLAVFLLSLVATHDVYTEIGHYSSGEADTVKEKMPGRMRVPGFILGVILTGVAVMGYNRRAAGEGMTYIACMFLGIFLLMKYGGCIWLNRKKKNTESYLKHMVCRNVFYHKFKTSVRYLFILTVIHISVLFVFTVPVASGMAAEPVEELYPYDVMCLANESDLPLFEEMEEELKVHIRQVPMCRVTTVDNTKQPDNMMSVVLPQGQNIGVSVSTYRKLKEWAGQKPAEFTLDDEGNEIYVVYQQDKAVEAHPIDWYQSPNTPYVRIGQPVASYNYRFREKLFPPRTIRGEETGSVTGCFRKGRYENLIVFSDAYFDKVTLQETEGATELVLFDIPEGKEAEVKEYLKKFAEVHKEDEMINASVKSYYLGKEEQRQRKTERMLEEAVNLFLIVLLAAVEMLLLHTKISAEMSSLAKKYRFLEILGMKHKERIAAAKKEVRAFLVIPVTAAAVISLILTGITLHLRQYSILDMAGYFRRAVWIYAAYIVAVTLDVRFLQRHILNNLGLTEEKGERKRDTDGR